MTPLSLKALVLQELATDQWDHDVTSQLLEDHSISRAQALVFSKAAGRFSGIAVLEAFQEIFKDPVSFSWNLVEGSPLEPQSPIVHIKGPRTFILSLERTLLNFLGLSCGVATETSRFVEAVKPFPTRILATRKTVPGLRALQLQAVVAGGGCIHRRSLSDGILIKENHLAHASETQLLEKAHQIRSPLHGIEIEVQSFDSLERVLASAFAPTVIMLDNMTPAEVARAVKMIRTHLPQCKVEASGGVTLETVRHLAEAGVEFVSVGKLTHSAPNLNLSLDFTS